MNMSCGQKRKPTIKCASSLLMFFVNICDKPPSEYYASRSHTNVELNCSPRGVRYFNLSLKQKNSGIKCLLKLDAFSFVGSFETWLIGQTHRQCSETQGG